MELWAIAREFGLPLAFLAFALYTGSRRIWVWGREVTAADERTAACEARWQKLHADAVAEWRERLRSESEDYERRLAQEQEAATRWEGLAWQAHAALREATHTLEKAVK